MLIISRRLERCSSLMAVTLLFTTFHKEFRGTELRKVFLSRLNFSEFIATRNQIHTSLQELPCYLQLTLVLSQLYQG